jgi:hypothetical protein
MRLTTFSPGMSSAVTTTTRRQSNASSRSIDSRRACGSVERIVAPYHAPGNTRSSVYLAAPVSLDGPSRRSGAGVRTRPGVVPGASAGMTSGALASGRTRGSVVAGGVRVVSPGRSIGES